MIRSDWGDLIKAKARQRRVKAKAVALPTELEDELTKVRALAPPPPSDDPIYKYLTSVYRLRCKVASSAELQSALKAYHKAQSSKDIAAICRCHYSDDGRRSCHQKYEI